MSTSNKTVRIFNCKICDKGFHNKQDLFSHTSTNHKSEQTPTGVKEPMCTPLVTPKIFKCRWCLSEFPTHKEMLQHVKDKGHYSCPRCDLKFSKLYEYLQHKEIHENEPPVEVKSESGDKKGQQVVPDVVSKFQCRWCRKQLATNYEWQMHLNSEGHHTCTKCNDKEKFETQQALNEHKLASHPEDQNKPPVAPVRSNTSPVATSTKSVARKISQPIQPSVIVSPERDLISATEIMGISPTSISSQYPRTLSRVKSGQVTIQTVDSNDSRPMIIHFLVDTSGSMAGTKIEEASEGLLNCMANFETGYDDLFTLITFNTDVSIRFKNLDIANALTSTPSSLKAEGRTSIYGAILQSLDIFKRTPKPKGSIPIMFVLTDGLGTDEELKEKAEEALANPGFPRFNFIQVGVGSDAAKINVPSNSSYEYWTSENSKKEIKKMFRRLKTKFSTMRTIRYTNS